MKVTGLSVVIPVYNSAVILPDLVAELAARLPALANEFEVILINDASRDQSWAVIEELCAQTAWLRGVNMMRNYGQHNAILCGIRLARHPILITMDDDLQHPPQEIHKLLEKLAEGYDVVYGSPQEEQHGLWRDLASLATKAAMQNFMGSEVVRGLSAFRALRTELRQAFQDYRGSFIAIDVLLTWSTTRFGTVKVAHAPRKAGVSNYTFRKLVIHALNLITGFSVLPLQIASLMGFLFTIFGGLVLCYVLGRYLIEGGSIPGFPFLASTIALFSGAQLFAMGVIGEYLARMYVRSMDKPTYAIRSAINFTKTQENDLSSDPV